MSWGCWKHHFGIPGVRPMFLKPKLHKESKNGFKTISFRRYPLVFFSKNYFLAPKIIKKWNGFTSNSFPHDLNCSKYNVDNFFAPKTVFWKNHYWGGSVIDCFKPIFGFLMQFWFEKHRSDTWNPKGMF